MKNLTFFVFFLLLRISIHAQAPVQYHLNLDQIHHHELKITVEFPALPAGPLEIHMAQASPGRYALHNFAKNVYAEKAFDRQGNPLPIYRSDVNIWQVTGHDGYVKLEYTLFGNMADGTYSGIDNRKIHLNMPATFLYAERMEKRPIELHIDLSAFPDWKVATQLQALDADSYRAPDYYYFMDSPTIIGPVDFRSFTVSNGGKEQTIEVAMLHEGTDEELDQYTNWVKRVVDTEREIFGSLPDYDFGKYTFLLSYNPWVDGDGMEHRNSTVCTSTGNLAQHASRLIGTVSHEFFHCWNVERIRPESLEPFDFDRPNLSGELWFAEGVTSYYTSLVLCRAGLREPAEYVSGLSGGLNYVIHSPGRQIRGPIQMSQQAPFTDAATANDPYNSDNTFISYYTYGSVIGLALDLSIRREFPDKSLDDLMRYMWTHFGRPEIPYQIKDIEMGLAAITGDAAFARRFFEQYIYGHALPDMESLLAAFGLEVSLAHPGLSIFSRLRWEQTDLGLRLESPSLKGTPLYKAGMNRGDVLLSLNGLPVSAEIVAQIPPGRECRIEYLQNGIRYEGSFTTEQDPDLRIGLMEDAGKAVEDGVLSRRNGWLWR